MRISLRVRVLILVFAINALLFGAGGLYLAGVQQREGDRTERALVGDLLFTLSRSIRPDLDVHAAALLSWPSWAAFDDALLVQASRTPSTGGGDPRVELRGLRINPLGRLARDVDFDAALVDDALERAVRSEGEVADVAGGRAVPIVSPGGGTWGACWYRRTPLDRTGLVLSLVNWFLGSTVLLTLGTFLLLNRLVLQPVAALARGAGAVRRGDLDVRVPAPPRRDEIADLVRDFNAMTAEVQGFNARLAQEVERATAQARRAEQAAMTQRRLAAMGELAAGIAHEINNPLGGLQNALERLRAGDLSPAREAEYLGLLERGLERIGRTVRQLLRFTPRALEHTAVDLADVARDAADLVRHRAEREGVTLVLDEAVPAGAAVCRGARNELGQAVLNLLVNALDALEEGGTRDPGGPRIALELGVTADSVELRVADNGPGAPAADLGRLADLFYSTKDVGRGSGLGLALVHNTLRAHGGDVELESQPGSGFTVTLRLPRLRAAHGSGEAGP
jgi:signal transduction histidine kinase